ncbi:MAG TPA: hypothetical protein VHH88_12140, partial [Verrucomicrobiae bacterium]|nr:hypothetical protein [Verrucomicrobiae bacterium]
MLVVPRGSPWSTMTFFTPVVMGRDLQATHPIPLVFAWLIHLGLALGYGLIVSRFIAHMTYRGAFATGALIGLGLYCLNLIVV